MLTPRRPLLPLQSAKLLNMAKDSRMTAKVTADTPGPDDSFSPALMQMFRTRSTQSFVELRTPTTDFKAAFCSIPTVGFTPQPGVDEVTRASTFALAGPDAKVFNSAPAAGQEAHGCAVAEEQQDVNAACAAAVAAALARGPATISSSPDITAGSNRYALCTLHFLLHKAVL